VGVAEFFTVSEGATPKGEAHLHVHHQATFLCVDTVGGAGTPQRVRGTPILDLFARTGQPSAFRMALSSGMGVPLGVNGASGHGPLTYTARLRADSAP
jgi:hypothetical protein